MRLLVPGHSGHCRHWCNAADCLAVADSELWSVCAAGKRDKGRRELHDDDQQDRRRRLNYSEVKITGTDDWL